MSGCGCNFRLIIQPLNTTGPVAEMNRKQNVFCGQPAVLQAIRILFCPYESQGGRVFTIESRIEEIFWTS